MSIEASIDRLTPTVKELVTKIFEGDSHALGKSVQDRVQVVEWLDKVAKGDIGSLKDLDLQLVPKTHIVSNYLTAADIALYGSLHPQFRQLQEADYYVHPALTRYFDHIQSLQIVRDSADGISPPFSIIPIYPDRAPKMERKVQPPKAKAPKATKPSGEDSSSVVAQKKASAAVAAMAEASPPRPGEPKAQKKKEKKEQKDDPVAGDTGKKKASAGGKGPAVEEAVEPAPSMIDLRVGHIVDVKKHPDADALYIEQIDLGEETGPRTVVSGLVHYIPIEEMRDKYLIAVCNLKPAAMRGVKSHAMVLCATSKDGKEAGIEIIQPPPNSKPGDRVFFEGPEFENATPLSQLNPKKKIFETIQPGFITLDTREAAWVNPVTKSVHRIRTKEGVCLAPTLVGASLS